MTSQVLAQQLLQPQKTCHFNGLGMEINFVKVRPDLTLILPLQFLIAAAAALGRDGYLHPAPLVAHIEILVVVAVEISSALHQHLAAWHRRGAKIQVNSSRRLLRA